MVDQLLTESDNLEQLLASVQTLNRYCNPDSIENAAKKVKARAHAGTIKSFVCHKLYEIVTVPRFRKIFQAEIQYRIQRRLFKDDITKSKMLELMHSYPDILTV